VLFDACERALAACRIRITTDGERALVEIEMLFTADAE
jgi:hypothetical protein